MFRLLLWASSGWLYKSTKNTTNCEIIYVESLNIIINGSNSLYEHKMLAYILLKSDKTSLLTTDKAGCIVCS